MSIEIEPFYDRSTFTLTYVVHDVTSRDAVIIDPVLDYDPLSSAVGTPARISQSALGGRRAHHGA
jgi:hypothetical protein